MKDLPYITHDFGARNDPKLMDLQMDMAGQGLGIFWCLVEMLWENGGSIPANYRSIAFALRWCTADEVEKVVTGYGLFEVTDGMISSHSATVRIAEMRSYFGAKAAAGRKGAERRWNGTANSTPIAQPMAGQCDANGLTNLLTNKQTNKLTNNNTPLTAAEIFEIFLLELNFKDPDGEAVRCLEYYTDREWTYQDGTPVTDYEQAVRGWKPAKAGKRWDSEALGWYRAVYAAAQGRMEDARSVFVQGISNIRRKGQDIALVYRTKADALAVGRFIIDNDLAGDWRIDYRVDN